MEIFTSKKTGEKIILNNQLDKTLKKQLNCNCHSYVRYRIARLFNKELYEKIFNNLRHRQSLSQELLLRREEITKEMLKEIQAEYGNKCVKHLYTYL